MATQQWDFFLVGVVFFNDQCSIMVTIKKAFLYNTAALLLILLFQGCGDQHTPPDYYFPKPPPGEAYVYHYTSLTEGFPDEYWRVDHWSENRLRICIFDSARGWIQCSYEYLSSTGVVQDKLLIFPGRGQTTSVDIQHGNLYPSEASDYNQVYLQYLRWYTSPDSLTFTEIIRNRRFDPTQSTEDEVVFELREKIEDFQEGYLEMESRGIEVFETGLGLRYFEKEITPEIVRKYTFSERFSVEDFNNRVNPEPVPEN